MPQGNPLESLQTLLRMKSASHVDANADPFVVRRRGEMASGLDDAFDEADSPEYKLRQMEDGAQYGVSLPRADYRSSDMSKLRQKLGLDRIEHEQALEETYVGQQASMDRILAAQAAQDNRTRMVQDATNDRSAADRDARTSALETRVTAAEQQQQMRDTAAMNRLDFSRNTPQAKEEPPNWLSSLWGMMRGVMPGDSAPEAGAQPSPDMQAPAEGAPVDPREELRRRYGY